MTTKCFLVSLAGLAMLAGTANAGLVDTRTGTGSASVALDGSLSAGEYGPGNSYSYAGAGGGFGGTLGASTMYMNSDANNLYLAVNLAANLNDNIVVYFNTKSTGGFNSSTQMDDASDPGRGRSSDPMSAGTTNLPINAQYSFVIGSFGAVLFELQGNGTAHNFKSYTGQFTGNATGVREFALNLGDLGGALGSRNYIDFLAIYTSDSGYMSNESIPAQAGLNAGGNPGFDNGGTAITLENYNRFQIPAPSSAVALGLAGLAATRRRRA